MGRNNLQFQGIKEAEEVFNALGARVGAKVLQKILQKNAKPLIQRARQLAPKDDGDLEKAIGPLAGRGRGKGTQIYVGPRRGGRHKGFAGHLVEYGTAPRQKADGTPTGAMPAKPFMRPAADATLPQVVDGIKADLASIISSKFKNIDFNTGELLETGELATGGGGSGGGSSKPSRTPPAISFGPKGGRFYIAPSGRKVYLKR